MLLFLNRYYCWAPPFTAPSVLLQSGVDFQKKYAFRCRVAPRPKTSCLLLRPCSCALASWKRFSPSKHIVIINSWSESPKPFDTSRSVCRRCLIFVDVQVRCGQRLYCFLQFRCPQKCVFGAMLFWQRFNIFWPDCRFVSTVQLILTITFMCFWFWRLRSFHNNMSRRLSVFSNSSTDSVILHLLIIHWLSTCVESFMDSEILYCRIVD